MEAKSIIAEDAIVSGRATGGAEEVSNIAGGGRPTRLTDAKAIIAEKGIEEGYTPTDEVMENIGGGGRPKVTTTNQYTSTEGSRNKFVSQNIGNQISTKIWSPERIERGWKSDPRSGKIPPSDELWDLTEDLVTSLHQYRSARPSDMLSLIDTLEKYSRSKLSKHQKHMGKTPMFRGDGEMVLSDDMTVEDKDILRRSAAMVAYFDSEQGAAFKSWLVRSAQDNSYKMFFQRAQPVQKSSGQYITKDGNDGKDVLPPKPANRRRKKPPLRPHPVTGLPDYERQKEDERIGRNPPPKPKPEHWRGVSKGAGESR